MRCEYTMSVDEVSCTLLRGVRGALGKCPYKFIHRLLSAYRTLTQQNDALITVKKGCPSLRGTMSKLLQWYHR